MRRLYENADRIRSIKVWSAVGFVIANVSWLLADDVAGVNITN